MGNLGWFRDEARRVAAVGVLYLADRVTGGGFTEHDESLLVALATSAGIAIENARLLAAATRRQRWLEATASVVSLLSQASADDTTLRAVAEGAREVKVGEAQLQF